MFVFMHAEVNAAVFVIYMFICIMDVFEILICLTVCVCVCVCVCVPQQLRIGLFLSCLNGNAELSESDFPLWGPSVATACMATHKYVVEKRCLHTNSDATRGQRHALINTFTHLSNCCPILQDVQVRQHINNIRAWVELRTVPQEAGS